MWLLAPLSAPAGVERGWGRGGGKYRHQKNINNQKLDSEKKHQGNLISVSRANGHLRFTSSTSCVTLRRLISTSARSAPRSALATRALAPTAWASASTASTFFRLARASVKTPVSSRMAA